MKLKVVVDNNIIVFLTKSYIKNIDLTSKRVLESYLNKLINKIKNKYDLDITGFYNVKIYIDENYGIIIDIIKETLDYPEYFTDLDMNIEVIEDDFIYMFDDIPILNENILMKFDKYKYKDKIYLIQIQNTNEIELGIVVENAKIIYGKKAKKIIKKAEMVL